MHGFYAIILAEQLEAEDVNYLDLLYTSQDLADLPTNPVWNPFASYSRIFLDSFTITRLDLVQVETTIATNAVSGAICSVESV